jgi:hypothetical protein
MSQTGRICLLGFGEVGGALSSGLAALPGTDLVAWDWQFDTAASKPSRQAARHGHFVGQVTRNRRAAIS